MGEIFTAHANRRSTTLDFLRFLLDGQQVYKDQTPSLLNLPKSSNVDCVLAQEVSVAPWPVDLNGNIWATRLALKMRCLRTHRRLPGNSTTRNSKEGATLDAARSSTQSRG